LSEEFAEAELAEEFERSTGRGLGTSVGVPALPNSLLPESSGIRGLGTSVGVPPGSVGVPPGVMSCSSLPENDGVRTPCQGFLRGTEREAFFDVLSCRAAAAIVAMCWVYEGPSAQMLGRVSG
jgi:hypothetical protein